MTPSLTQASEQSEGSVAQAVAAPPVSDLEARLTGLPTQRDNAIRYIFEHPDAVPPIDFIYVIKGLLERGDNAQAAFGTISGKSELQLGTSLIHQNTAN
jgi:hypothetical protein